MAARTIPSKDTGHSSLKGKIYFIANNYENTWKGDGIPLLWLYALGMYKEGNLTCKQYITKGPENKDCPVPYILYTTGERVAKPIMVR
ncbi:MAG: hypothetical protein ACYDG6_00835 [Thermincolia bacterium]